MDKIFDDFEVISTYTRAQAIADGVLIDASQGELGEVSREHYKWPIAMTAAVYELLKAAVNEPAAGNDWQGVWHDVLWISREFSRKLSPTERVFSVLLYQDGTHHAHGLKMVSGHDDEGKPCLTVMLPDED